MSNLPVDPKKIPIVVFSTRSSDYLADLIFTAVKQEKGKFLRGQTRVLEFSNQNVEVQVTHNVRGHFAIIIHTQVIGNVNRDLFELFGLIDALQNAKVGGILLVFPYMPYVRSDRKNESRKSTMAKAFATMLNGMGVEHILILDPHSEHVPHYFSPAANTVTAQGFLVHAIRHSQMEAGIRPEQSCIVYADAGSVKRFEEFPVALGMDEAFIVKQRNGPTEQTKAKRVVGNIANCHCYMLDDEILTGGTIIGDAKVLLESGAASVRMVGVHGILADNKLESQVKVATRLQDSPIDEIVITNSVPCSPIVNGLSKFKVLDLSKFLAEAAIRSITTGSVSELMGLELDSRFLN